MQLLELQLRLQNHAKPQEPVEVVDGLGRDVKGKINGNVIVTAVVLGSENDLNIKSFANFYTHSSLVC